MIEDFMSHRIYLDYCATTPIHPDVRNEMLRTLEADFGNPSSLHWAGKAARQLIDQSRLDVANGIGCQPNEVIFTSGATEADNIALFGILKLIPPNEAHLITSATEHHAILHAAQQLEREGYSVTCLPVDRYGLVNLADIRKAIRPETRLISIMSVNNEVGSIQPVAEIGKIAREYNILFHTDAVQAVGLFDVNVDDLQVDLLSLSAHKIYGPKGIGALYIRSGIGLSPMLFGGLQERSLRAGTENVPGIVGLGAAMNLVREHRAEERARLSGLRKYLVDGLQALGPGVIVNGLEGTTAPHVVSVSFTGADAEMLQIRLNDEGVAVSLGSACNSKSIEPSHVLTAMNLPLEQIESTLRISLGMPTTKEEIDFLFEAIARALPRAVMQ
jgi:cysteine desulfurase